jgi:hypothetical protein
MKPLAPRPLKFQWPMGSPEVEENPSTVEPGGMLAE